MPVPAASAVTMNIAIAILTVSDTAAKDPKTDLTGPSLAEHIRLEATSKSMIYEVTAQAIVPDDERLIRHQVELWCHEHTADVILTAGGTGFGDSDRTPEAITPLLEKTAPGIVHALLSTSLAVTPFAALSRPVAGIRQRSLIVTFPGSPKAARENWSAVEGVVGHAVELLKGGKGEGVHAKLGAPGQAQRETVAAESSQRHHHEHHHHHHHHIQQGHHSAPIPLTQRKEFPGTIPARSVTTRPRQSPFPIILLEEAFSHIFHHAKPSTPHLHPVDATLVGHVLAEDVASEIEIPLGPATNVDGYACVAPLEPGTYRVRTALTHPLAEALAPKSLYRINTGAPLPINANAVIMVEDTTIATKAGPDEMQEEAEVTTLAEVPVGENVRSAGSDVRANEVVLEAGQPITGTGGEIGSLAFVGRSSVLVRTLPKIAIFSTGNELVDIHTPNNASESREGDLGWHGIFDSNRPSLLAALTAHRFPVSDMGILPDSPSSIAETLRKACTEADVVITTGGTSMGEGDWVKPVLGSLGGQVHFGRVAMKPGKPTTFATIPPQSGTAGDRETLVFALPGNPASCLVTLHVFVIPALRKMAGFREDSWHFPTVPVKIAMPINLDPRPEFHRVVVRPSHDFVLKAHSTGGQRSSRTVSLANANALLKLPPRVEGTSQLAPGSTVDALIIGSLSN